jgi:hypothetical protein
MNVELTDIRSKSHVCCRELSPESVRKRKGKISKNKIGIATQSPET